MSDLYEDHDDDSRLVKDLRKQLRDAQKQNETLQTQVTELSSTVKKRTVEEALASKGVDKRIAQFIPSDTEDVDAWLDQNGDLFGIKKDDGDSAGSGPAGLSPEDAEAARRMQNATGGGSAVADRQKQQIDAIRNATTKEELDALVLGAQSGN
jgi:hypothetical protein